MSVEFADKMSKKYIGFIRSSCPDSVLIVAVVDSATQQLVPSLCGSINARNAKQFLNNIPLNFGKNFQSIIVSVKLFDSPDFSNNLEFCKVFRERLDLANVPYHFISDEGYIFILPLYAEKITVKYGEIVAVATMRNSNLKFLYFTHTQHGYLLSDVALVRIDDLNENAKKIRAKIACSCNPKEIVIMAPSSEQSKMDILKKKMPAVHFLIIDEITKYEIPWLIDYSKWMEDKSSVKTLMIPYVDKKYFLYKRFHGKIKVEYVVAAGTHVLPFTQIWKLSKSHCRYVVAFSDPINGVVVSLTELVQNKKTHENQVTLEIDMNNFPSCSVDGLMKEEIINLPAALDKMVKTKVPVIGFYQNISFICVCKDGENYDFLESCGGMNGSELYISFDEENPKYGEAALAVIDTKPTYVVYDLLKIMSMPPNKINVDNTWPFKIIKDSEHPVLLEFDNFDGAKSAAVPSFLMAMLLKQHLKAIKAATNKKPKQIGLCLLEKDASTNQLLKNQLVKSCKLLKVGCRFFNV